MQRQEPSPTERDEMKREAAITGKADRNRFLWKWSATALIERGSDTFPPAKRHEPRRASFGADTGNQTTKKARNLTAAGPQFC